jgi:hypothetical protein
MCLEELGEELVHTYQGRESSGRTSNEIVLDSHSMQKNNFYNQQDVVILTTISNFRQALQPVHQLWGADVGCAHLEEGAQ